MRFLGAHLTESIAQQGQSMDTHGPHSHLPRHPTRNLSLSTAPSLHDQYTVQLCYLLPSSSVLTSSLGTLHSEPYLWTFCETSITRFRLPRAPLPISRWLHCPAVAPAPQPHLEGRRHVLCFIVVPVPPSPVTASKPVCSANTVKAPRLWLQFPVTC